MKLSQLSEGNPFNAEYILCIRFFLNLQLHIHEDVPLIFAVPTFSDHM